MYFLPRISIWEVEQQELERNGPLKWSRLNSRICFNPNCCFFPGDSYLYFLTNKFPYTPTSVYPPFCLSIFNYLSVCLFVCLYIYNFLSVNCLFVCLSIYNHLFVYLSVYLSIAICLFVYLSVYLSIIICQSVICLSVYLQLAVCLLIGPSIYL